MAFAALLTLLALLVLPGLLDSLAPGAARGAATLPPGFAVAAGALLLALLAAWPAARAVARRALGPSEEAEAILRRYSADARAELSATLSEEEGYGQGGARSGRASLASFDDPGLLGACWDATAAADALLSGARNAASRRAAELDQASGALREHERRLELEASAAKRLQRDLAARPAELPLRPELGFGALLQTAAEPGGAFYDAFRVGKNGLVLVAAEPDGSGPVASLAGAVVKEAFRTRAAWGTPAVEILARVDEDLAPVLRGAGIGASAALASLDLESGRATWAVAGSAAILLHRRRTGEGSSLGGAGGRIAVPGREAFASGALALEEGDRLLVASPGLPGLRGAGPSFGAERAADALAKLARERPDVVPARLAQAALAFAAAPARREALAMVLLELKAYAAALDRLGGSRRPSASEDWALNARLAVAAARGGRLAEAAAAYERLRLLDPEDSSVLNNLGALYWRLGRAEEALARFRTASRLAPRDERIARNLAMAERGRVPPRPGQPSAPPRRQGDADDGPGGPEGSPIPD